MFLKIMCYFLQKYIVLLAFEDLFALYCFVLSPSFSLGVNFDFLIFAKFCFVSFFMFRGQIYEGAYYDFLLQISMNVWSGTGDVAKSVQTYLGRINAHVKVEWKSVLMENPVKVKYSFEFVQYTIPHFLCPIVPIPILH